MAADLIPIFISDRIAYASFPTSNILSIAYYLSTPTQVDTLTFDTRYTPKLQTEDEIEDAFKRILYRKNYDEEDLLKTKNNIKELKDSFCFIDYYQKANINKSIHLYGNNLGFLIGNNLTQIYRGRSRYEILKNVEVPCKLIKINNRTLCIKIKGNKNIKQTEKDLKKKIKKEIAKKLCYEINLEHYEKLLINLDGIKKGQDKELEKLKTIGTFKERNLNGYNSEKG